MKSAIVVLLGLSLLVTTYPWLLLIPVGAVAVYVGLRLRRRAVERALLDDLPVALDDEALEREYAALELEYQEALREYNEAVNDAPAVKQRKPRRLVPVVTAPPPVIPAGTPIVCFDVETTGLDSKSEAMTEIAGVKLIDGVIVDEFATLVNAGKRIPAKAIAFNGITNAMIKGAPSTREAVTAFFEWAGNSVLVAHNAPYDISFLHAASHRHEISWPGHIVLDTLTIARQTIPRDAITNYKLPTLADFFGFDIVPNHRALSDAHTLAALIQVLPIESFELYAEPMARTFWREYKELEEASHPSAEALKKIANTWYKVCDGETLSFVPATPRESLVRGRHFTDWVEPIKQLKRDGKHDDALELILECVAATEQTALALGESPAPAYTEMAAIAYRKSKDYANEVAVLERYFWVREQAANPSPGALNQKLRERLGKARELHLGELVKAA